MSTRLEEIIQNVRERLQIKPSEFDPNIVKEEEESQAICPNIVKEEESQAICPDIVKVEEGIYPNIVKEKEAICPNEEEESCSLRRSKRIRAKVDKQKKLASQLKRESTMVQDTGKKKKYRRKNSDESNEGGQLDRRERNRLASQKYRRLLREKEENLEKVMFIKKSRYDLKSSST